MSAARWSRQVFVVLSGALVAAGVPSVATASPETPAYLGEQTRHTLDQHQLADRARLGVNVANGNLVVKFDDVQINGRGLDVSLSRTYNSRGNRNGQFGRNWTSSVGPDSALEGVASSDQTWWGPTGQAFTFALQPDGSYTSPPGANATLALSGSNGTLTFRRTGTKIDFTAVNSGLRRPTAITDRNGNAITLTYSGNSLATVTDTQGRNLTFSGGASITDPTGRTWQYGYTGSNLTSYTDPENKLWSYRYDASNRLDKITDPRGNETLIAYDASDRVTSVTRRVDGTTTNDVTTAYAYPTVSAPCTGGTHAFKTVVTDPRGKATTYCADNDRQVTRVRNALNQDASSTYTPNGDVASFTNLAGTAQPPQTTLTHDTVTTNITGGTLGAGESFSQKYCGDAGEPTCATLGFPTAAYAPTRHVNTEGSDSLFGYDSQGNLTDVKDGATPRNRATMTYNADGTMATMTDGRGSQTTFAYFTTPANQVGNLKTITPPATSAPGAMPGLTQFTYDNLSRVQSITDGRGVVTSYTYDKLDRVTGVGTSGGGPYVQFTYDGNGNLTQRLSSTAGTTSYGYDKLNRRTSETFPGALSNTYGYDKGSNLASLSDPSGTATYSYDDIDRVASIVAPHASGIGTDTITYSYSDNPTAGDPTTKVTATYPGGATQRTDRNASGRVAKVVVKTNGGTVLSSRDYSYTDASSALRGQIQSVTDQAGAKTTYTYKDTTLGEDVGRLLKARTETSAGALMEEFAYAYDEAGNRTRTTRTLPSQTMITSYAYNAANQLCWRWGSATSNTCGSPPAGAISYLYDGAGNQLSGDQGTQSMAYDPLNRVSAVGGTSVSAFGDTANELKSFGTTNYHNTLLGLTREWIGSNVTSIVRHPDTGSPVSERQAGVKRYFLQDALGSTTGMLNATAPGSIPLSFTYSPDGNENWSGSGPVTNQRFAGALRLPNTFLYHFGARFYDVTTARWTQQEPLVAYQTLREANRYAYVGGDPINLLDPTGESWIGDALEIGGLVITTGVICGSTATGLGAVACVGALSTTTGVIANKAEGWGKSRKKKR
jgi:RHS repeat-associated protein